MNLDWLIIGGGVHGVHIATRLIVDAEVPAERLGIVDPGRHLLERWQDCTATTGMTHLRSPSVHHLDIEPMALQKFAGNRRRRGKGLFAAPFERPSLKLFNAHCESLTRDLGLEERQIRCRAETCSPDDEGVTVVLSDGRTVRARSVVLAMGAGDQPLRPEWIPDDHPGVHHVFERGFSSWPSTDETTLLVGGGISAGHVALRLVAEGHRIHLISRHAIREHRFDSDPGWLGPKYTADFHREPDHDRRRQVITRARNRGSMPPEMGRAVRRAISRGDIQWHEGEVVDFADRAGRISIRTNAGSDLTVDRILLATGFASRRPGGSMIDELVRSASLPCASCGYPIVDHALRWHPRIHVSGPLAELELGPVSRNIAGARRAGDRIVAAARESHEAMRSAG